MTRKYSTSNDDLVFSIFSLLQFGHLQRSDQCTVNGLYSCPHSLQVQTEPFCLPATEKSWHGLPPQIILNGLSFVSPTFVISPRFNDSSTP